MKTDLIEQNWDDLFRVAGSLKLGTVSATEIMRALHRGRKPSTIAKAIGELGKITKTLYLLNYVDDEAYRRRILTQLNRGESRHSLARAVFYGRRGELRFSLSRRSGRTVRNFRFGGKYVGAVEHLLHGCSHQSVSLRGMENSGGR